MVNMDQLIHTIQVSLLVFSGALVIGVLYGMGKQGEDMRLGVASLGPNGNRSGREKRREPRVKCNVYVEIMDRTENVAGIGRLVNLSTTGACIASNSDLRQGEPVLARLPNLRAGANKISGLVIWARPTTGSTLYGIQLYRSTPAR